MKMMITGHRPNKLYGYNMNDIRYTKLKTLLKRLLVHYKVDTAISGMALGVDTLFAQAVLELRNESAYIELVCAIPCLNHSSKWFPESVKEYDRIVSLADKVIIVSPKPYQPQLMQVRNEFMVDYCTSKEDMAVAIWDGSSGGTGNCVNYIQKKKLKLVKINPFTGVIT